MKKLLLAILFIATSFSYGQNILTQSQEIRTDDLYFGVSQTNYNFGGTSPISARFGAWHNNSPFNYNYNAAGIIFNRWRGSGTNFSNAYIGQAFNNNGMIGLSFEVSNENSKDAKPIRRMFISPLGNVGIDSNNPDSKLTVNGKIHCKEVKVDLAIPADYVFEKYYTGTSALNKDYVMPTLEEVAAYTKANKHLPAVPSAQEIKDQGLHLKEMTNLLLQKVEELTLYTIEQEKRIKALEAKLAATEAAKTTTK